MFWSDRRTFPERLNATGSSSGSWTFSRPRLFIFICRSQTLFTIYLYSFYFNALTSSLKYFILFFYFQPLGISAQHILAPFVSDVVPLTVPHVYNKQTRHKPEPVAEEYVWNSSYRCRWASVSSVCQSSTFWNQWVTSPRAHAWSRLWPHTDLSDDHLTSSRPL